MRDLRIFVAAYEELSFTAAARRENATQSGVSQHIRKLEDRYGSRLFHRDGGKIAPTPAGDSFYRRCLALLRANEGALAELRSFAHGLDGSVSVGLMPTTTAHALAPALLAFGAEHPNAHVHISEGFSAVLLQSVLEGALDFAVVPAPPIVPGLSIRPFVSLEEVLITRRGEADPADAATALEALPPLSLILPEPIHARHAATLTFLAAHDVRVERTLTLDSMAATIDLVGQSHWSAIVPALLVAGTRDDRLTLHRIRPAPRLELVTVEPARRAPSPTASAFRDVLQQASRELLDAFEARHPAIIQPEE